MSQNNKQLMNVTRGYISYVNIFPRASPSPHFHIFWPRHPRHEFLMSSASFDLSARGLHGQPR
jgi:hypothetical protein